MKLFIHDRRAINQGISLCAENDGKRIYTEWAVSYEIKEKLKKEFPGHKVMKKNQERYVFPLFRVVRGQLLWVDCRSLFQGLFFDLSFMLIYNFSFLSYKDFKYVYGCVGI